jgi:hypothetical protein
LSRAEIQAAIIAADVRLQVTQLYVEAVAADRRVAARDQARIASDALRAASVRVQAGRASHSSNSALMSRGSMPTPMWSGSFAWRKRRAPIWRAGSVGRSTAAR